MLQLANMYCCNLTDEAIKNERGLRRLKRPNKAMNELEGRLDDEIFRIMSVW